MRYMAGYQGYIHTYLGVGCWLDASFLRHVSFNPLPQPTYLYIMYGFAVSSRFVKMDFASISFLLSRNPRCGAT